MLIESSDRAGRRPGRSLGPQDLLLGAAASVAVAVLWVILTGLTDRTYHLAPPIAAVAPAAMARAREVRHSWRASLWLAALGLVAAIAGWLVIVAAGIEPSATLVEDQPGGVTGEVVVGALAGAVIGAALLRPARS